MHNTSTWRNPDPPAQNTVKPQIYKSMVSYQKWFLMSVCLCFIWTPTDFRGCALSPEVVKIGEVAKRWRESVKYCRDENMELVSFSEAQLQRQIYNKIIQAKTDKLQEVWIGMRRSSQTGEWYWLNRDPVNDTNWADGEPGTVNDGQCAIMSLEKDKASHWRDEDCCKAAHPVCYSHPVFFPI